MKMILALAIASFGVTAAHAGSKSVLVPVIGTVPIYYLYNTEGPEFGMPEYVASASVGPETTVATTATPRSAVNQTGYGPDAQDAVYAKLLKEAQKRGLR